MKNENGKRKNYIFYSYDPMIYVYESKKTEAMSSRIVKWLAEKEKTIVYFPYAQNAFDASRGVRGFAGIKTDPRIGVFTGKNVDELSTETFNEKKRETFEKFRTGEQPIMYATKAFGMGVDIDDVQNVYHYAVSGNLCDYIQEIGRVARKPEMTGVTLITMLIEPMMNGEKTSLAFVKGDPMGKLVKLLRMLTGDKYGYDYSDIVILTLKTESESIMNNISKISGIPITREKSNSSILFTTAKKFKGLESRVIIIVDIDESSFNDEKEKRNFYVACSRATQYLSLIVEGDDQKIKSIADVIAGPNFAPKGKIAMKTQATPLRLD